MTEETKKALHDFFSHYPLKKFPKGQVLLKPGQRPDFVGFVKSGYIRVYTISSSGQEITMAFFKPLLYFTTIYAMTDAVNKFYFETVSPIEIWEAPKGDFIKYCRQNSVVANEIMVTISNLFLTSIENAGKLLAGNSLTKVAMIICSVIDSKSNFALTHKLIASLTGLTRETVTLQMLKLEKMGLIQNENRKVTVLNRAGLEKI